MPCSDGCYSVSIEDRKMFARQEEMLCEACQLIEANNLIMPYGLSVWWLNHKQEDAERLKREIAKHKEESDKKSALEKLTPYERKLLGVRE